MFSQGNGGVKPNKFKLFIYLLFFGVILAIEHLKWQSTPKKIKN
jgi:hypothetical protein